MDHTNVLTALQRTLELVQSSRSSPYSRYTVDEIVQLLQRMIRALESGKPLDQVSLGVLFAPTGSIQETSLANGWGDEYLALSKVVDAFLADERRGTRGTQLSPDGVDVTPDEAGAGDRASQAISVLGRNRVKGGTTSQCRRERRAR